MIALRHQVKKLGRLDTAPWRDVFDNGLGHRIFILGDVGKYLFATCLD
jgi:hypothetical protein